MIRNIVKSVLKNTPFYHQVRDYHAGMLQFRSELPREIGTFFNWTLKNSPIPPNFIKRNAIRRYASRYSINVLVETGTYQGDTIFALRKDFKEIYSIELGEELFLMAQKRFENSSNIQLFYGDSAEELGKILQLLGEYPVFFFLDAHPSGGITAQGKKITPIITELEIILARNNPRDVIFIDDARGFLEGEHRCEAYPSLQQVQDLVRKHRLQAKFWVMNDSIRIIPGPIL